MRDGKATNTKKRKLGIIINFARPKLQYVKNSRLMSYSCLFVFIRG